MAYIITSGQKRHAVATLDEARKAIESEAISGSSTNFYSGRYPEIMRSIEALDTSGGTVGPLPDGTIIEVEPIGEGELESVCGIDIDELPDVRTPEGLAEIVAAFNEVQD